MAEAPISYPRQEAATRRFRLGLPRAFRLSADGTRVCFIRSAGGRDPVGSLWAASAIDGRLVERRIVDAPSLVRGDANLPAAERARRERMRETTAGITAYSADAALTRAVFSLDGTPYTVDLVDPTASAVELPHPGPVVDPQLSPDGRWVAYVHERALYGVATAGDEKPILLAAPDADEHSWGLADFVAAEELDRVRGLWWLGSNDAVLAQFVDESPVEVRWIGDPAQPEVPPRPHRYPAAGTANPIARLFVLGIDGSRTEVTWDRDTYPYLATVEVDDDGGAVVSVLDRAQQSQLILGLAAGRHEVSILRERHTEPWLTMMPGVPRRTPAGALLEIVANTADDVFQLVADDAQLTPVGINVTGVAYADAGRIVVTGTTDPRDQHVFVLDSRGHLDAVTSGASVNSVVARGDALVLVTSDSSTPGPRFEARLAGATGTITSLAEIPVVVPHAVLARVGDRQLTTAVLMPTGHVSGSGKLPVVMAPYGGPHHARVSWASGSLAPDQWLADQGFAVVVVDGTGTPGRGPAWEFAVHRDVAHAVLDDQVAALMALAESHPDLDLTRVGIMGWSFGGYLAGLAVLERPDVFRAAVAGAPVTDWRLYDTAYTERYLGMPQDNPEVYDACSLLTRASKLTRPLLLIHGLADDNVLAANTLQFSSALLAAGRPHSVLPLSGVTHMTPQEVVAENLLRLQVEFFATSLA